MTLANIIRDAFESKVSPERAIGACRVYVSIVKNVDARKVQKACEAIGVKFQKRGHYGTSEVIYCGYDNFDGMALARGSTVASALKANGIECYRDEHGD